jgi:hypothetical protein
MPRLRRRVAEGARAVAAQEHVRPEIGDEEVDVPVAVDVARVDAHSVARIRGGAAPRRDVREARVSVVGVEPVGRPLPEGATNVPGCSPPEGIGPPCTR